MVPVGRLESSDIRPTELISAKPVTRISGVKCDAPLALLGLYFDRHLDGPVSKNLGFAVGKWNMHRVVFEIVEEITRPLVGLRPNLAFFVIGVSWKCRRLAVTQVSKDKAQIFSCRITADSNGLGGRLIFGGNFQTLPGPVIFSTMVAAADAIVLNPTQ